MKKTPKLVEYNYPYGPASELACPGCGGNHIHHGVVTVFSRYEDQERTVVTTVTPADREAPSVTSIETNVGDGNPSSRRHGLTIQFTCEECPGVFVLAIGQHKGHTEVEWHQIQ